LKLRGSSSLSKVRAAAALSIACSVWLSACGAPAQDQVPAESRPVLSVELVGPQTEQWPDRLSASGEVAAWQEAVIGTEVAGLRLREVRADVGDVVKRGDLLARYDEDSLRAELARLDAEVTVAEATLVEAQADAERVDRLQDTQAISAQAAQAYRTAAAVAQARLESAKAQRAAQQLQLRYARIIAPDDGIITSRSATLGSVGVLGGELFRLLRDGRLEWRAEVPSAQLARLKPGVAVEIVRADGAVVAGTLRQLAPTVDARTRNGIAYVDVPADSGLAAGMYVSGHFVLAEREALTIPEVAVVLRDGNSYLMRVDAERRVHQLKVRTGRRRDGAIEILDGIAPDDRFVRSGGAFLADGDLVDIAAERQSS
jgi:HlyD family secretion protein